MIHVFLLLFFAGGGALIFFNLLLKVLCSHNAQKFQCKNIIECNKNTF